MKTTILALGLMFALNAHATVPTKLSVSGTVTAVKEHSIEIDGRSYPIDVKSSSASELENVAVGDKVSIQYAPGNTQAAATQPSQQVHNAVSKGLEVVNPATAKSAAAQVLRASVTKAN
jgi:hypothetical protein